MLQKTDIPSNEILHALPSDELFRLLPRLTRVTLQQHDVLYSVGSAIEHAYFLETGLVSLLAVGCEGDAIETGIVGSEGMLGGVVVLGCDRSWSHATVQIGGRALRMPIQTFLEAYRSSTALQTLVLKHLGMLLQQAQQNTACHALHSVEARMCRWMLQAQDALGGNVLDLTQEFLSHMLGVQRTSVSMIAHALQNAGLIRYSRGRICIMDRLGLEGTACECYRQLRDQKAALLSTSR